MSATRPRSWQACRPRSSSTRSRPRRAGRSGRATSATRSSSARSAFLFPILILVGTATRLAAARREERYAALRLVGATIGPGRRHLLGRRRGQRPARRRARRRHLHAAAAGAGRHCDYQRAVLPRPGHADRRRLPRRPDRRAGRVGRLVAGVAAPGADLAAGRQPTGYPASAEPLADHPAARGYRLVRPRTGATTRQSIGAPALPGLLVILIGLVVGGPWLTAQAARLFGTVMTGASTLLAARRLSDNPRAAFRSVSGLVLAVFLGTVVAGLLPAVESLTATPSARAMSNVLLDGFLPSPICGNTVNCNGNGRYAWRTPADLQARTASRRTGCRRRSRPALSWPGADTGDRRCRPPPPRSTRAAAGRRPGPDRAEGWPGRATMP